MLSEYTEITMQEFLKHHNSITSKKVYDNAIRHLFKAVEKVELKK